MNPDKYFKEIKAEVLEGWYRSIIENYPKDSGKFFLGVKDRFANPVGYSIKTAIDSIYDEVFGEFDAAALDKALETIIQVRAVQDFAPSEAVGFLFYLKTEIRKLAPNREKYPETAERIEISLERIDRALLAGFDKYMQMRERLYEIKSSERKKTFSRMVDRLNRKYGYEEKNDEIKL